MNNEKEAPRHFFGIDILRFAASMLVVWYHYGFWMGVDPNQIAAKAGQGLVAFPELYDFSNFGWVGVQIFFVISGFVIAISAEKATYFKFFLSRVIRLAPCVWICASFTLLALWTVSLDGISVYLKSYVRTIFFAPVGNLIDPSYWTLAVEISFYSMVFILIVFDRFIWLKNLAIVIGLTSTVFWVAATTVSFFEITSVASLFLELEVSRKLSLLLVHHGVFFSIGILLWLQLTKYSNPRNIAWGIVFSIAGCLQIIATSNMINQISGKSYSSVVACLIWLLSVVAIIYSIRRNKKIKSFPLKLSGFVRAIGLMTFPLYLLHQVTGAVMMGWLVKFGFGRWEALVFVVIFEIFFAWFVAMVLEKRLQNITRSAILKCNYYWGKSKLA